MSLTIPLIWLSIIFVLFILGIIFECNRDEIKERIRHKYRIRVMETTMPDTKLHIPEIRRLLWWWQMGSRTFFKYDEAKKVIDDHRYSKEQACVIYYFTKD